MKLLLSLLFAINSTLALSPVCQLVDDHEFAPLTKDPYNNGYPESRYHLVLNEFIKEFTPDIEKRGGTFHILRDWSDGAVNAWAWRIGDEFWLEVPGGMSRYHLINEFGFLTTLCHELGHLEGGAPHGSEISYEGQADYYSTMKCMHRILKRLGHSNDKLLSGIKSLTSYYAFLEKSDPPQINTPDLTQARQTLRSHPKSQCRFDTMVRAMKCDNKDHFSYDNPNTGACQGSLARPLCWYRP